jgi:hypothetical protein
VKIILWKPPVPPPEYALGGLTPADLSRLSECMGFVKRNSRERELRLFADEVLNMLRDLSDLS